MKTPVIMKYLGMSVTVSLAGCSTWDTNVNELEPTAAGKTNVQGQVYRDYWLNIKGNTVDSILSAPGYPDTPEGSDLWSRLQAPTNQGNNFGSRITGLITPPADGAYTFYLSSDDQSAFSLSSSTDNAGLQQIAFVPAAVKDKDYTRYGSQVSAPVNLKGGQPYRFELLHKEGGWDDHVAVEWEGPSIARQVVEGQYLSSGVGSTPVTPDVSEDFIKGYSSGYRIGYFDGDQNLTYQGSYPFLDEDSDGMYDNWEVVNGLDPSNSNDAASDADGDLLSAFEEFGLLTSPNTEDTDGDGVPDGAEFAYGLNPLDPADGAADADGDGYDNATEYQQGSDVLDPESVPASENVQSYVPGFVGQYFRGTNFDEFVVSEVNSDINFNWGSGAPNADTPKDKFSVRWTGQFIPPHSSGNRTYAFTTDADDGVRLWVGNELVVDHWSTSKPTTHSGEKSLPAEEPVPIRMEYFESGWDAKASLKIVDTSNNSSIAIAQTISSPTMEVEGQTQDLDSDGIPDSWELRYGLNPFINDSSATMNSDGVSNLQAYQSGLNPWTLEDASSSGQTVPPEPVVPGPTNGVTLKWALPLTRVDGSSLAVGEIDHFELSYGRDAGNLDQSVSVPGTDTTYVFDSLESGTWYFDIKAVDTDGLSSPSSETVSTTVE